jgi:hypothetical protein
MLLIVRRMLAAAEACEPGPIWRSRLNFTSSAVSLSPLCLAGPEIEGPGEAVGGELPAFGDAGADAAFLEVEADQRVVHHRLVDRIARPPFEDRIERLGAQRLDGEDERALLVLGAKRRHGGGDQRDGESSNSPDVPEHKLLPNVDFDFGS